MALRSSRTSASRPYGCTTTAAVIVLFIGLSTGQSFAIPNLQVWSPNWTSVGDSGPDTDTWFVSASPFDLWVIGDGPQTNSIRNLRLIVSVPQRQIGTITGLGTGAFYTTVGGSTGFLSSVPAPAYSPGPNQHYPFQDSVSDFWVYEFSFTGGKVPVNDYNAETGVIGTGGTGGMGWIKVFNNVSFAGFDSLHFDVIGFVDRSSGQDRWDINPGSHDVSTTVPEPSTLLLLGAGLVGFGILGRRKFRS